MSTDRLSYFGHAPRGELWEAGGQINGYYRSHRLITEHLEPGTPIRRLDAEGFHAAQEPMPGVLHHATCDWQVVLIHPRLKLLYISEHCFAVSIYSHWASEGSFYINTQVPAAKKKPCEVPLHYMSPNWFGRLDTQGWSIATGKFCKHSITCALRKRHK